MAVESALRAGLPENVRAAGFMVLACMGFSVNDAFMKSVSGEVPLFQAVFLRGLIATVLIGALAWRAGALSYRPGWRDRRLIGLRSLSEIGGTVCFLLALFNMPIAGATAILQSLPLAVTLAAAVFFGEPVGWRRFLAIAIGFVGVMIIVRPGSEGFTRVDHETSGAHSGITGLWNVNFISDGTAHPIPAFAAARATCVSSPRSGISFGECLERSFVWVGAWGP